MAITVQRASAAIRNRLGADLSDGIDDLQITEMAYAWLLASKEGWRWANPTAKLASVAGEKFIALPADFQNLAQHEPQDYRMRIVPDAQWLQLEVAHQQMSPDLYFARIVDRTVDEVEGKWLEFISEFESDTPDRFWVAYERGPISITDADQELPLPIYMHQTFLHAVRALALGWDEADEHDVEGLLHNLKMSRTYDAAVMMDARQRPRGIQRSALGPQVKRGRFPFDPIAPIVDVNGNPIYPTTL